MAVLSIGQVWAADVTGTIYFNNTSSGTAINGASVTGDDSQGNEWTVTTVGTTSFTASSTYYQVGSGNKPATSITFTTTLSSSQTIKAFSAKFGGFNSTAGTVTLKVGDTSVGSGSLSGTSDVTVDATNTTTSGTVLTVSVTGIAKGVKAYYISYTYDDGGDADPVLQSIAVSGTPSTKTYEEGNVFDVTGLVVTGTYDKGEDQTITEGVTWEARTSSTSDDAVDLSAYALTQGQTALQVRATVSSISSAWTDVTGLIVNEHVVTPGKYEDIVLGNALWGTSYTSTNTSTTANALNVNGSTHDIHISLTNGSSTSMYITDSQTRAYTGYTLTFTVPTGYNITKITFTKATKWGLSASGLNSDADEWTGEANSVSFSFTARTDMTSVNVTYAAASACTLPSITTQPVGATYDQDDAATALSVVAEACDAISGSLSYQWYSNTSLSNEGGSVITGETDASFTPATDEAGDFYYYCVVNQGEASVVSDAVKVSVEGPEVGVGFEQELSAYTDWTFTNILSQQTGTITAHTKTYYGATDAKASASMVTAAKIAGPDALSFYVSKKTDNTTASTWTVKVSANGTDWSDAITTKDAKEMSKGNWDEVTADLSAYTNVYVGIFYEGSTAVRTIDDVILTTRALESYVVTFNDTPDHGLVSIENGGVEITTGASVIEGDVLDVILAADEGYLGTVAVTKTTGGDDVTDVVYDAATGKLTMPAYAITVTATFAIGVETPVFDPASGSFTSAQLVTISTTTTGATIYYTMTTDGSTPADPTSASTPYDENEGITLDARGTYKIKAIAYKDENKSNVTSAEYTLNLPFASVSDLFTYLEDNSLTSLNDVTVKGYVSHVKSLDPTKFTTAQYYISDNGQREDELYIHNGKYLSGADFTDVDQLAVGDKVTIRGDYLLYNGTTHEINAGNQITERVVKGAVTGVAISGTANKTTYSANETFETDGLVVTATYANEFSCVVTDGITWGNDLTDNKVTASTTVHVTATVGGQTSSAYDVAVTVASKTLVSITATTASYTIYTGEDLPKPTIMATFSEGDPEDVSVSATYDSENVFNTATIDDPDPQTITVSYTFGGVTETTTYTVSVKDYANADDNPYTVTEALYIITNAIRNVESAKEIVVTGTVSEEKISNTNGRYKISDGTNELLVYNGKGFNNTNFTAANYPKVSDAVVVKGKVINYGTTTPEFVSGKSYLLSQIRPATIAITDVTGFEVGDDDLAEDDLTIETASTGDITFTSGNVSVVTIVEGKLHAVAAGTATITANLAATENEGAINYTAASTTFSVTVIAETTKYAIAFDGNGANGGTAPAAIADKAEGAEVTLPANTWTKSGSTFAGWKVINNTTSAEITITEGKFTMPASAVTIQAQWAEISVWATTYTSNVKLSGATESTVVIGGNEFEAMKAGTSSAAGDIDVAVPAHATTLHFHASGWQGREVTLNLTAPAGITITPASVNLTADDGASGSGTTYTLANDPSTTAYFAVTLSGNTDDAFTLNIANTGSKKQFVLFGVNQEGGDFGSYQRSSLTPGNYATICLPNGGTISGAELFDLEYFDGDKTLYLLAVNGNAMVAGRPYIFLPSGEEIAVSYTDNKDKAAGSFHGLVGSYVEKKITENDDNYILYNNQYYLVNSQARVGVNRAYIHMPDVPTTPSTSTPGAAPRRRVAMTVNGENAATGFENIESGDAPMKVMIDGTLYILRGEKVYDATGRLVK